MTDEDKAKATEERGLKMKAAHDRVRDSMTPTQLATALKVDEAFEAEREDFDARFHAEAALRKSLSVICGFQLDMTEAEELRNKSKLAPVGKVFSFNTKRGPVRLYKTVFGTIDSLENYLQVLERATIDVVNNSQFTPLRPRDLIKLALKRIFTRSST